MNELIVGMLELAKYESGTYHLKVEEFDVQRVIDEVCELLDTEIRKKKLLLSVHSYSVRVLGNPLRIEQVLTNFMSNATRFTPMGGSIVLTMVEEPDRVKISVENEGINIPLDQLDKVWDRFYRSDASRLREGGSGLGLAIAKNILELHGVQYGVANLQNGMVFYFWLPKVEVADEI